MEPLLLAGYGIIFLAIAAYVWHLRSRIGELEAQMEDLQ